MVRRSKLTRRNELTVMEPSALETMAVMGAIVAALYLGRAIAIPIAIAILISFSLGPLVTWLRHHHAGRIPSVIIVVIPALVAVGAFAYVVTTEIGRLAENVPSYQTNIEQKLAGVQASLPAKGMLERGSEFLRSLPGRVTGPGAIPPSTSRPGFHKPPELSQSQGGNKPVPVEIQERNPTAIEVLQSVLSPLVGPLADTGMVLLFVVFFLVERDNLRDRILRLAGAHDLHRTTMAMDEAGYRVSRFLLLQLLVNALYGVAIALGLFWIGVPNAALWGGIATILRFIPYLGVVAAALLPLALAFAVDPGWGMLFWTGGLFLGLELLVGNVVEPWLYGSSTGLSAVALVVSAIFWTWLWGAIGLLLATPLTVCIAVLGRYVPQLAFLDVVLGNAAPLQPEESFYQRLLAGDPDEATQQAEEFLKFNSLAEFYDQVGLPALALAERDRARGVLDDDHRARICEGLDRVIENLGDDVGRSDRRNIQAEGEPGESEVEAPHRFDRTVLCVAGRGDLDERAAAMLAQLLADEGFDARVVSLVSALRPSFGDRDIPTNAIACLSYMNGDSVPHARYLGRRFRRWLGSDAVIVVGFWRMESAVSRGADLQTAVGADAIVTTLQAAIAVIASRLLDPAVSEIKQDAAMTDLVDRVSEIISDTA